MNLGWILDESIPLDHRSIDYSMEWKDGAIDRLSVGKIKTATRRENSEYLHERTSCSLFCLKRERKGERERKRRSSTSKIYFLSRRGSVVGGVAERGRVEEYRGSGQNKVLWEERNKFAWITIKLRESASLIALSLSLSLFLATLWKIKIRCEARSSGKRCNHLRSLSARCDCREKCYLFFFLF